MHIFLTSTLEVGWVGLNQSGEGGKEKNLCPCWESNTGCPAYSLATIPSSYRSSYWYHDEFNLYAGLLLTASSHWRHQICIFSSLKVK
jgi:hypothetical protein